MTTNQIILILLGVWNINIKSGGITMIAIAIGIAIAGLFIGLGLTRLAESLRNRKININIYHKDNEE